MIKKELTYPEQAGAMAREARIVCCEKAGESWEKAVEARTEIAGLKVDVFNYLRDTGISLNEASGRGQLTFNINGKEFCRKELLPNLPKTMSVAHIESCCHIANTVKEPIQTPEELKVVEAAMKPFFEEAFGKSMEKKQLNSVAAANLFSSVVSSASAMEILFKNLKEEQPMESWPLKKGLEFLETMQPIKEEITHAEKLFIKK